MAKRKGYDANGKLKRAGMAILISDNRLSPKLLQETKKNIV